MLNFSCRLLCFITREVKSNILPLFYYDQTTRRLIIMVSIYYIKIIIEDSIEGRQLNFPFNLCT